MIQYCNYDIKGTLAVTGVTTLSNQLTFPYGSLGDYIYHTGDGNTYFGFPSNDVFRVVTAGTARFEITSSTVNVSNAPFKALGALATGAGMAETGVGLGQLSNYAHAQFSGSTGGYIDFAEPNVDYAGRIIYTHGSNAMQLVTSQIVALTLDSSQNATFAKDLTVSGGDIILGGTGRIQGVDTVSSGTDAANKTYVDNAVGGVSSGVTSVATTNGITGGTITSTGTIQVDSTVVRTTGTQTIAGEKTFTNQLAIDTAGGSERMRLFNENNTSPIADSFSGNTSKSYIYFDTVSGSNDPGYIMHESSSTETNEGVLHIVPSDDNSTGDYVSIHGTNDADILKLHTSGLIETANLQLQLKSGNGSIYLNDFVSIEGDLSVSGGDITLGGTGRIQGVDTVSSSTDAANKAYVDASVPTVNNATITIAAGTNLTTGGNFTTNQSSNETITINMATGGVGAGTYGSTSNSTKIDNITVDAYGRVTGVTTGATGQVNTVSTGNANTIQVSGTTGVTVTANTGTVSSSSSNLATGAQIQTAINSAVTGVLKYQGTWNANTNSPSLSSGSGTPGYYYIVSTSGSTNLDGITDWKVGDWAVFSDQATDAWQKIDNTQVGNVTGSGANTRIPIWNSSSNLTSDSGLTFNTSTNLLTVGGQVNWSGGHSGESNSAYDNMITAFSDSGSSTITLTLTQNDGGTLTTSFSNPQGTMSSWTIKEGNGTESTTVTNGETLTIAQGSGIQSEMTSTSSGGTITITNTDKGSSQAIYKNIATQSGTATANSNNDTLTITGTGGTTTSRSGDTITINSSDNNDNYYLNSASFNTGNGVLTLNRSGGLSAVTVDLDGRYSTSNFYLDDITRSGNTLTFSVNGTTDQTYTYGSNAFNSSTIYAEPGIFSGGGTPTLASGVTGAEVRTLIGAGTGSGSMSSWTIKEGNGTESTTVTNGETFTIAQGTGITSEMTSTSSGGTITITNTSPDTGVPAILSNGTSPTLNTGISAAEVRSLIGAGTGTVTGTGVSNRIAFWTNTSSIASDSDLTYNLSLNRLVSGNYLTPNNGDYLGTDTSGAIRTLLTLDSSNNVEISNQALSTGSDTIVYFGDTFRVKDGSSTRLSIQSNGTMSNSGNTFNCGPINLNEDDKITFDDDGDQWNYIQATSGQMEMGVGQELTLLNEEEGIFGGIKVQEVYSIIDGLVTNNSATYIPIYTDTSSSSTPRVQRQQTPAQFLSNAGGVTGSGYSGRVAVWSGSGSTKTVSSDTLYWNSSNNVLGVNYSGSTFNNGAVQIQGPTTNSGGIGLQIYNSTSGAPYGSHGIFVNGPRYGNAGISVKNPNTGSTFMRFYSNSGSSVGTITQNGSSSTSYNTSSDYRLKENIEPMSGSIERIKALKPCKFNFINEEINEKGIKRKVDGFLAHEASSVVPEAVTGQKDELDYKGDPEYQSIDQSKLVPLLTSALQEALAKIESLETRLNTLEQK